MALIDSPEIIAGKFTGSAAAIVYGRAADLSSVPVLGYYAAGDVATMPRPVAVSAVAANAAVDVGTFYNAHAGAAAVASLNVETATVSAAILSANTGGGVAMVGTRTAHPVAVMVNGAAVARFDTAGGFALGADFAAPARARIAGALAVNATPAAPSATSTPNGGLLVGWDGAVTLTAGVRDTPYGGWLQVRHASIAPGSAVYPLYLQPLGGAVVVGSDPNFDTLYPFRVGGKSWHGDAIVIAGPSSSAQLDLRGSRRFTVDAGSDGTFSVWDRTAGSVRFQIDAAVVSAVPETDVLVFFGDVGLRRIKSTTAGGAVPAMKRILYVDA